MRHGLITRAALAAVGVFVFGLAAAAQSYWLPSGDLIRRARQDEAITPFINNQCAAQQAGVYVESVKWSGNPAEDVQTITHLIKRESVSSSTTHTIDATTTTYYGVYDKKEFADVEELNIAFNLLNDRLTGQLPDPWAAWFFYICNYTIADKFDYSGDFGLNSFDKTIKTTSRDIADCLIKYYGLKDFSRESQIELLDKTKYSLWRNKSSEYSDVESVSAAGIDIRMAIGQEWLAKLKAGEVSAIEIVAADNPLAVIVARTLGLDMLVTWYNLENLGEKYTSTINAQSL